MPLPIALLLFFVGGFAGVVITYFFILHKNQTEAGKILKNAEIEAEKITKRSDEIAKSWKKSAEEERNDIKERKKEVVEQEKRLQEKESRLDKRFEEYNQKHERLNIEEKNLEKLKSNIEIKEKNLTTELEKIAQLTTEQAREEILQKAEERYERDIVGCMEKKRKEYKKREAELSREILLQSIQQYAGDVTMETTQTIFPLESDDLKGKLIGKEGRNIIAFERATGVSLIIDDSPDTVFISSFDLFRRYIAKKSLEDLIADKRIQPARIEEIVEKNQNEAEKLIRDLGQKTVDEMGIMGIPEDLYPLIGKFRFRTSYGQNLLMHSKEVAYISKSIAQLIGADAELAFVGGLLHDIGKAMDHDIE